MNISFEGVDDSMFETTSNFCRGLLRQCAKNLKLKKMSELEDWKNESIANFDLLMVEGVVGQGLAVVLL
jgi:hypothetical protein